MKKSQGRKSLTKHNPRLNLIIPHKINNLAMTESIIHEFGVLFSRRVHQKDKKWEDGMLRIYEFNNKLEVYSDARILVMSDFHPSEIRLAMLNGVFDNGKSYKFPSDNLIIETIEYYGSFTRILIDPPIKPSICRLKGGPQQNLFVIKRTSPQSIKRLVLQEGTKSAISTLRIADQAQVSIFKWDSALCRRNTRISPRSNRFSQLLWNK